MKPWTRNRDIQRFVQKKWDKGIILRHLVSDAPFQPMRIPLKYPTAAELSSHFEDAREWIAHLTRHAKQGCGKGYDLEWRETNHRTLGRNKIPIAAVFSELADILFFLKKHKEAEKYKELYVHILGRFPELKELLMNKPFVVLAHDEKWPQLLSILSFIKKYPRPMIYMRQLEIPGMDTKFVEHHKNWLTLLLDQILHPLDIDENAKGKTGFEQRFGFLSKPVRIRFRILDPDLYIMGMSDLELPVDEFQGLTLESDTVFIVENEVNGLAFPLFPKSIVIFGLGYGLSALSDVNWIQNKSVWYWGDIDTHGFAMLDQIRHYFP